MKTLVRMSVLLVAAAAVAGVVYPLIAVRPPIHCEDVFRREQARDACRTRWDPPVSFRAVPRFVFQGAIVIAIATGARKVLGVSLNRRNKKD
jgi:hypothetical protein